MVHNSEKFGSGWYPQRPRRRRRRDRDLDLENFGVDEREGKNTGAVGKEVGGKKADRPEARWSSGGWDADRGREWGALGWDAEKRGGWNARGWDAEREGELDAREWDAVFEGKEAGGWA